MNLFELFKILLKKKYAAIVALLTRKRLCCCVKKTQNVCSANLFSDRYSNHFVTTIPDYLAKFFAELIRSH